MLIEGPRAKTGLSRKIDEGEKEKTSIKKNFELPYFGIST